MIRNFTPSNHLRVCPYCLNSFNANNGNRLYCPKRFGKQGYCKAQMKVLNAIKKQGGRTTAQRLDFLKKHLHRKMTFIYIADNKFLPKKEFRIFLIDNIYPTSEFFIEGPYLMRHHQEDNLYHVSLLENASWLKTVGWKWGY
jgi:hypothetical protein